MKEAKRVNPDLISGRGGALKKRERSMEGKRNNVARAAARYGKRRLRLVISLFAWEGFFACYMSIGASV